MYSGFRLSTSGPIISNKYQVVGVHGSTLDATMKLLCAVVRGIIERKDKFVLELQVSKEQDSLLDGFKEIAKDRCAVTVSEKTVQWDTRRGESATFTLRLLKLEHVPCVTP